MPAATCAAITQSQFPSNPFLQFFILFAAPERGGGRTRQSTMENKKSLLAVLVLTTALLFLSFPQGTARRVHVLRHFGTWNAVPVPFDKRVSSRIGREMNVIDQMDYAEPGANTNPRNGAGFGNVPPPTQILRPPPK